MPIITFIIKKRILAFLENTKGLFLRIVVYMAYIADVDNLGHKFHRSPKTLVYLIFRNIMPSRHHPCFDTVNIDSRISGKDIITANEIPCHSCSAQ